MTELTLDQKYASLIDELAILNGKFDKFMNGDEYATIPFEGGNNIKSLSGIAKDLRSFKYVQKVINHRLYQDMVEDTIEEGMLIRVWGDAENINGLYKKTFIGFDKSTYSDLYDLRDFLPNPWNYSNVTKNQSEFDQDLDLCSFTVPNSAFETNTRRLSGTAVYTMDGVGSRGSISFDFTIVALTGDGSPNSKFTILLSNLVLLAIDSGFSAVDVPVLGVRMTPGALDTKYTVTTTPFKAKSDQTPIPARLSVNFYHIDKSYKVIT